MRIGERLIYAIARDRAVKRGADATKVARVTDEHIQTGLAVTGALAPGSLLSALWAWVQSHPQVIEQIIQIILAAVAVM